MSSKKEQLFSRIALTVGGGFLIGWMYRDYNYEKSQAKDPFRAKLFTDFREDRKEYLRRKVLAGKTVEEIMAEVEREDKERGWR